MTFAKPDSDLTQLRADFDLEQRLAAVLRAATPSERPALYADVYDEFARLSLGMAGSSADPRDIARQVRIVTRFLPTGGSYLEVGAGSCAVAAQVALGGGHTVVVEASSETAARPAGVERIIADATTIPVAAGSIDLVFSHQVLEHLHPDDAKQHAVSVKRCLRPGGAYVCITPNRFTGPHDVSKHFSDTPEGLHLREYSLRDQNELFAMAGFRRVAVAVVLGGEVLGLIPARAYCVLERAFAGAPTGLRQHRVIRKLLDPGAVVAYV